MKNAVVVMICFFSSVVKKVKKQALASGFFHILLGEYLFKQKVVVMKPPEWKFMTITIARFWSKMGKN